MPPSARSPGRLPHADEEAFAQRRDPHQSGPGCGDRDRVRLPAGTSSGFGAGDCGLYGVRAPRKRVHSDKSAITATWSDGPHTVDRCIAAKPDGLDPTPVVLWQSHQHIVDAGVGNDAVLLISVASVPGEAGTPGRA